MITTIAISGPIFVAPHNKDLWSVWCRRSLHSVPCPGSIPEMHPFLIHRFSSSLNVFVWTFWFNVCFYLFMKLSKFHSTSGSGVVKQWVAPQSPSSQKTNPNSVGICLDHSEPLGKVLITLCVAWKRSTIMPGNIDSYYLLTLQQSSTMTVSKGLSKEYFISWSRSLISLNAGLFVSL